MSSVASLEETKAFLRNVNHIPAMVTAFNTIADDHWPVDSFPDRVMARRRLANAVFRHKLSRAGLATLLAQHDGEEGLDFKLMETDYVLQMATKGATNAPESSPLVPAAQQKGKPREEARGAQRKHGGGKRKGAPKTGGKISQFAGKTLVKTTNENPHRATSKGVVSWEALTDGIIYEDFLKAGGRSADLSRYVGQGWVTVK